MRQVQRGRLSGMNVAFRGLTPPAVRHIADYIDRVFDPPTLELDAV